MEPRRTPLAAEHEALGGRMVNFSGHWMPVQYRSILEEARHVRREAGLFDLCHMGRFRVGGPDAVDVVHRLVTCDVTAIRTGRIKYALLTREDGTIIDDVLVYREPESIFLCVNAGNRARDLAWLRTHAAGTDATVEDLSDALAMIAVQGPRSAEIVAAATGVDVADVPYYGFRAAPLFGWEGSMVSRTGYTGEDGYELYVTADRAVEAWRRLLERGGPLGLLPIGLGARDTLRLEAGMPLYGHEIDDTTTPVEAGLGWAVRAAGGFVGAEAIQDLARRGTSRRLVGFTCAGKRVPRIGYPIFAGAEGVGEVRSGTASPTLGTNVGTAYVVSAHAAPGTRLDLDLRGDRAPIEIVPLPFYRRAR